MITIKDYAKRNNVTYEAVRKQLARYQSDLEGHITKVNRTQYLDDEAVAFLDTKRLESPIILFEQGKDEEIEKLKQEREGLLIKIAALADWKADNAVLIAESKMQQLLLKNSEDRANQEAAARADAEKRARAEAARADELEEKIAVIEQENEAVKRENEALRRRSLWQRIWNK